MSAQPDNPLLRLIPGFPGDVDERHAGLLAQLIDWAEFWAHDHGSEEWIAWPLIPAGRQVALFAIAKTGKSIIALAACAAIATGRSIFGAPPQPARSVLYLDFEMTTSDLQERLESLGYGPEDDMSNLHYALLPSLPPLNTPAGCRAVCDLAALVGAEVVVIDTMGRAVEGEENSSDTYKDYARGAGIALRAAGRAVLRTDHAGKTKEMGQRGSSAKNDDVDVVLRLDVAEEGWVLIRTHSRVAWVPEKVLIRSSEDDEGRRVFTADRAERTYVLGTKELADQLRKIGVTGANSRREASQSLVDIGAGARTKRVSDALAWLRQEDSCTLTTLGTRPGTGSRALFEPNLGTTGHPSQTPRSDDGTDTRNRSEPEAEADGHHPRYVSNGWAQPEPETPEIDPTSPPLF